MSRTDFEAAYIERYGHRPRGWNDDFQVYQDAHANGAWFGWQARAAGIEAKAAPAGEREAAIDWYNYADWGNECFKDGVVRGFQAGAAYQRAQQPQSAEPVAFVKESQYLLGDTSDEISELLPIGTKLYTTPQPSAGVVMPDDIDSLDVSIDLIDRLQHSNMSVKELELASSEKNVLVNKVRKLLARLNGKEVGRG